MYNRAESFNPFNCSSPETKQEQIFQEAFLSMQEGYQENIGKISTNSDKKVLMIYKGGLIGMINVNEEPKSNQVNAMTKFMKEIPHLCDKDYTFFYGEDDFLITPPTLYGKRVWYKVVPFEGAEGSNGNDDDTTEWISTAQIIERNYDAFDAFVILHDTDTMAYTASALSFMFENLSKTVILTGSQVPLGHMRNDAFENLLGALTLAGHFTIPEVSIYFCSKLFRGNRATKIDSFELEAFGSPNMQPLGDFGIVPKIEWDIIQKLKTSKFFVQKNLSQKVGILKVYPSMPLSLIKNILNADLDGYVIEGLGAGNLPFGKKEIKELIRKASEEGKILVVISQCSKGNVSITQSISDQYEELCLVPGLDMTAECAVAKLAYLLGKGFEKQQVKELMQRNLRGELTEQRSIAFKRGTESALETITQSLQGAVEHQVLTTGLFPTLTSYAAHFGFVNVLEKLKDCGTSFESGDYEGRTPLHIAAKCGQKNVVKHLISQQMDSNILDKRGKSPLFEAISNNELEIAESLLAADAQVYAKKEDLRSLMFKLILKGDLEKIKLLYRGGVRNFEEYSNIDKRTIGHIACAENQENIVLFLKEEAQFDFSVKDRWGQTPLDEAIRVNNTNIINIIQPKEIKTKDTTIQEQREIFIEEHKSEGFEWLEGEIGSSLANSGEKMLIYKGM